MKDKGRFLFYFFLIFLVVSRVIKIINTHFIIDTAEKYNLFISSHLADGVAPLPSLFQTSAPYAGGGSLLFNIIAVPFIWLFGKSYFSLRLASIVILAITYFFIYKFCRKHFDSRVAVFASLLFIFTQELVTLFSVAGEGRHFHLNLFFILSLYLFAKIKENNKVIYYLLFGMAVGLAIYFYPAFLVTLLVFGLFLLLAAIDIRQPSLIYRYLIIVGCVIIAGMFLRHGSSWYSNLYIVMIAKEIVREHSIIDNIFLIIPKFIILFFKVMPNIFAFSNDHFKELYNQPMKSYFTNLSVRGIFLELFRLTFITSYVSLCWNNIRGLGKIIYNTIHCNRKKIVSIREYITIFLLVHLFIYILIFSSIVKETNNSKYYLPLFINIILIIALFLREAWQKNKCLSSFLLISILSPGIIFQYNTFTTASMKEFHRHYIYFYDEKCTIEQMGGKPLSVHRLMCDKLNINVCHTLGVHYARRHIDEVQEPFENISNGDIDKLRYLYQGYVRQRFVRSKGNVEKILTLIKKIDKKYWESCYIGLGEGLVYLIYNPKMDGGLVLREDVLNLKRDEKVIEEASDFIKEDFRKYFFQGIGEGFAKQLAKPYPPYITNKSFFDEKINDYLETIDNRDYRTAFLIGFHNKDIWTKY